MTRSQVRRMLAGIVAATPEAAALVGRVLWVSLWQFPWWALGLLVGEAIQCTVNGWRAGREPRLPFPS